MAVLAEPAKVASIFVDSVIFFCYQQEMLELLIVFAVGVVIIKVILDTRTSLLVPAEALRKARANLSNKVDSVYARYTVQMSIVATQQGLDKSNTREHLDAWKYIAEKSSLRTAEFHPIPQLGIVAVQKLQEVADQALRELQHSVEAYNDSVEAFRLAKSRPPACLFPDKFFALPSGLYLSGGERSFLAQFFPSMKRLSLEDSEEGEE